MDPWKPGDAWWEAWPADLSGNTVNGVGEAHPRRPTKIFWHYDTRGKVFGEVQDALLARFLTHETVSKGFVGLDRGPEPPPECDAPPGPGTPEDWTRRVKAFALNEPGARPQGVPGEGSEAELVGIAKLDPLWIYEGEATDLPNVILLGVVMDHAKLARLPGDGVQFDGQVEVGVQYARAARVCNHLTAWIRAQGYRALPQAGPMADKLNMIPAALAAGFGELGDHGSIINRKYGSSFRLSAVMTDMPLLFDAPDRFGADEFCQRCQVCHAKCPPRAISKDKKMVRGVERFYVDFDKCLPYFSETLGCGICLAVCPWSYPGRAEVLARKWGLKLKAQGGG